MLKKKVEVTVGANRFVLLSSHVLTPHSQNSGVVVPQQVLHLKHTPSLNVTDRFSSSATRFHPETFSRSLPRHQTGGCERTLTWPLLKGSVKSPCSRPFFSMNTTLCLLGCRWVLAIRLPEGLKHPGRPPSVHGLICTELTNPILGLILQSAHCVRHHTV